jgi:hypothetical protein
VIELIRRPSGPSPETMKDDSPNMRASYATIRCLESHPLTRTRKPSTA